MPIHWGVLTPNLRGSCDDRHHMGQGAQQQGVCLSPGECSHQISKGAETTDTNQGWVPSNLECAYPRGVLILHVEGAETTNTTRGTLPRNPRCD